MSLLINGMDMPKNCYHCRFNYDGLCHALRSSFTYIHENDISCPYNLNYDAMIKHGIYKIDVERTFEGIKQYLTDHYIEGIVFWKDGEPQCKIKRSDFGLPWGNKQ